MKTLLLMRHAKAGWDGSQHSDLERSLNQRGMQEAPQMGAFLKEEDLIPQLILASPAKRSRQTVEKVVASSSYEGEVQYYPEFYMAEAPAYLERLGQLPDDFERVLVVGHNPGLEGLLQILSGEVLSLSTGSLAQINLSLDTWQALDLDTAGDLVGLWRPKDVLAHSQ